MRGLFWALLCVALCAYVDIARGSEFPPIDLNDPITKHLRNRGAFARMTDAEFIEYWHNLMRREAAGERIPNTPLIKNPDNKDKD